MEGVVYIYTYDSLRFPINKPQSIDIIQLFIAPFIWIVLIGSSKIVLYIMFLNLSVSFLYSYELSVFFPQGAVHGPLNSSLKS